MRPSHWMDGDLGDRWEVEDVALGIEDCPSFRPTFIRGIDAGFQGEELHELYNASHGSNYKQDPRAATWKPANTKASRKVDKFLSLFLSLSMLR